MNIAEKMKLEIDEIEKKIEKHQKDYRAKIIEITEKKRAIDVWKKGNPKDQSITEDMEKEIVDLQNSMNNDSEGYVQLRRDFMYKERALHKWLRPQVKPKHKKGIMEEEK